MERGAPGEDGFMELAIVLLQSTAWSLVSPVIFVPAIFLGWFVRSWLWVLAGAVLIAVAALLLALDRLPAGAEMVWATAPLGIVPPLLWATATFKLRRWMRERTEAEPGHVGVRVVWTAIGGLLGAAAGVGFGFIYADATEMSNFEGGIGYFIFFFCLPIGALIGLVGGTLNGWRLSGRRKPAPATPAAPGPV